MQAKRTMLNRKYVERHCRRCNDPYTTRSDTTQWFCSLRCGRLARGESIERSCRRCEAPMVIGRMSPRQFCSRLCKTGTDEERFWASFIRSENTPCWNWSKYISGDYGRMRWRGEMTLAHRVSWMIHVGPIPDGLFVLHKCPGGGNSRCVNPAHLAIGDYLENSHDMMKDGRHWSATQAWRPYVGEQAGAAVMTEAQVIEARRRIRAGELCQDVARDLGVNKGTLACAVRGQSWAYLTNPPPVRMKRGGGVYPD